MRCLILVALLCGNSDSLRIRSNRPSSSFFLQSPREDDLYVPSPGNTGLYIPTFDNRRDSREIVNRSYAAKKESFSKQPPYDVNELIVGYAEERWAPYRWWSILSVLTIAYTVFPSLVAVVIPYTNSESILLTNNSLSSIGILFGTLISVTYSILYERQASLQDVATKEAACLVLITRNLLSLFSKTYTTENTSTNRKTLCFECVKDHAETLIDRSRLQELLQIMNLQDPLVNLLVQIDKIENGIIKRASVPRPKPSNYCRNAIIILQSLRKNIENLMDLRSCRLGQESVALPYVHFVILAFLSFYQLVGYIFVAASKFPLVALETSETTAPLVEVRLLFAVLTLVFLLTIIFALDLNQPFAGAYQVRRSGTSAYLLQVYGLLEQDRLSSLLKAPDEDHGEDITY